MKAHKPPVGPAAVAVLKKQVSPAGVKAAEARARALLAKKNGVKAKPTPKPTPTRRTTSR